MTFANPAGWWFALAAIPVIAVHVLRPRRAAHVVSSTFLWETIENPVTAATPFKRLRPSWLLALQLLAVALLAGAIADPVRVEPAQFAPHTVFLLDASGSMQALDGEPDRIADARTRAIELRDQLPTGGLASVVEIGAVPRVLLSTSSDREAFVEAVSAVRAGAGRADFAGAFSLAEGLETSDAPIGFVLVSDGGLSPDEQRLLPPGTAYERVGRDATNRAIVALEVEPRADALHVVATVANRGGPATTQTLRLDVDGRTRERVELRIASGATIVHEADLALGDRVEAYLEGEDLLAADNRRSAVARRRQTVRVGIDGDADPFLIALLESVDGVEIVDASAAGAAPDAAPDLVVYAGVRVPAQPDTPFLAIRPPGGAPGITVAGEVENPALTLVRATDPLLQGIDVSALAIASAQRIEAGTAEVLLGAESAPLLVRGRTADGVRFAYLPFALTDSNLPVQLAFPLLGDRLIADLAGAALPPTDVEVGEVLSAPDRAGVTIVDPNGTVTELAPGIGGMTAERPGVWTIAAAGRPATTVAVNPPASESNLTPVPALQTEKREPRPGEQRPVEHTSMRHWVIAALGLVLLLEFLLARRQVGVQPRQWRLAVALRVVTAIALLGAAFGVGINRDAGRVATVFVVDASDSLGSAGRAEALTFVRSALDAAPDGTRAGVVLFGGDARIEVLLSEQARLGQPSVQLDPTRTDLAAALRLGGAILPDDARRRIVLVSDGRATDGDAVREAALLRERGIAVDTVLVDAPGAADVAVAATRTPDRVTAGERIPVIVDLESTTSGPATVELRRDGELIDARTIELVPGRQTVEFSDIADESGPRRYQVDVVSGRDGVGQNNTAFAATDVEGPPRILVVEGVDGEATELAGALTAGALDVETVAVADLPGLEELTGYSSIVLVDVDRRQLTTRQEAALAGAVRDAGRGLVTVGGDQSYGLGGYYTSELERLLPVVSEILDPKRRQTVAQVLAIDSSGSMGACHCAEGQFASNRADGGVNKTDISRAAAARTIAALGQNDEVGVLAFDVEDRWIIDLQALPPQDVVNEGLSTINPDGGTNPATSLSTAADALRASKAALKHIILFTDGFTSQAILADLADQAEALTAEGITVSVVATGEGASRELIDVAERGQGRFYPGRDLQLIPELIMEEAILASRDFVNEGEFLPAVTSARPVVAELTESPPLFGYIATTAKPTAATLMSIGPDDDPLLATWHVGLGTATSWTSDASDRWSQAWATWDGYVGFWSRVVRDTFPVETEGTTAVVDDGVLRIRVEGEDSFGDGATAVARVTDPLLAGREITMDRVGDDTFVAEVPVDDVGVFVVGTSVTSGAGEVTRGSTLTSQSYSPEYRPTPPDGAAMERIAEAAGGRFDIAPTTAFDRAALQVGRSRLELTWPLLLLATLAFTTAVVLSRLSFATARVSVPASSRNRIAATIGRLRARRGRPVAASGDEPPPTPVAAPAAVRERDAALLEEIAQSDEAAAAAAGTETMSALLERARANRQSRKR